MKHVLIAFVFLFTSYTQAQTVKPFGAVPSPSQLKWHELEYYMFIHFGHSDQD